MFDLDRRVALITGAEGPVWACLSPPHGLPGRQP
jgi:hypothetical protein